MLKIENIATSLKSITPAAKYLFLGLVLILVSSFLLKHPFYISVVDIKQDVKQHSLNISVKLFTNDIENALKKTTTKSIDLLNPKNKADMETELMNYIKKRLTIIVNNKATTLDFIGYEREEDAIWAYLEIKKINQPKDIKVDTKLLYDDLPQQTNIVHAEVNGIKKSSKVINPDSKVEFSF
ncbi:MAG: hypothetical protein HY062_11370 [Bacteroidetes bacterium]|nr:hypothetical protein [Bacteroidota bacterium]